MSLQEMLSAKKRETQNELQDMGPEIQEALAAMETFGEKLKQSGMEKRVTAVGAEAPDFALPTAGGQTFFLSQALENGPAALVFFRGKW